MGRLKKDAIARLAADVKRVELGDPRRADRALDVLLRLARSPDVSLPEAMETTAELLGAYRLLNNERVSFDALLAPHLESTVARAQQAGSVLVLHDTTTCMFPHADPDDVGYLPTGKAGFLLHVGLVVDANAWRRPLGIIYSETLCRAQRSRQRTRTQAGGKVSGRETRTWADKEYDRWGRGIAAAQARLGDVKAIHVADSETDSYALMATLMAADQRFIFRARHNRRIDTKGKPSHMQDALARAPLQLTRDVPLARRLPTTLPRTAHKPRPARVAHLHIASAPTTLQRPRGDNASPSTLTVNVVHVFEPAPPAGEAPVEWLIHTTEPIATATQVEQIVDAYRARWLIEEFNKALKTGCVVQERQLESRTAVLNMLALSLPIAVELLALRSLARQPTARPASDLFSSTYLAALRALSHRPLPRKPSAQDALWCIAGVGGHIKNNGDPGWMVLQRGMQKFLAFAEGWTAREEKM